MSFEVYLSLGSNLGDREKNLKDAVHAVSLMENTRVERISGIYETEPVGYTAQGKFLNMAMVIDTSLAPQDLLHKLQQIEKDLKRTREIHWGPRTIDIDILLYDGMSIDSCELTVPHPRMFGRAFVLVPLKEIYPRGDIGGRNLEELLEHCGGGEGVVPYRLGL